ncbi:MAG: helix-turn-helix transcriptional regulator [Geobacteraceae bacterium]
MKVEVGKRLKQLRTERGITQKELAARVRGGLDYTYIGKIERGEQLPSLKILIKISEALALPVGYFFQDEAATIAREISASALGGLIKDEKGRELLRSLQLLHYDDVPLVTEIIRVLSKHRNIRRKRSTESAQEGCLMAAEEGTSYGKE